MIYKKEDFEKAAMKLADTLKDTPLDDKDFILALFKAGYNMGDNRHWTEITGRKGMPAINTTVLVEYYKPSASGLLSRTYSCAFWDGEKWRINDGLSQRHDPIPFTIKRWMSLQR